ncbi:hypothetical protein PFISCL1PPCAC_3905, partial [Pristionchus fissidentatus]
LQSYGSRYTISMSSDPHNSSDRSKSQRPKESGTEEDEGKSRQLRAPKDDKKSGKDIGKRVEVKEEDVIVIGDSEDSADEFSMLPSRDESKLSENK